MGGQKYLLRLQSIPRYVPKSSHSIPALSNLIYHQWHINSERQYETLSQLWPILSHSTLRLVHLQPTQNLDHMLTSILTIFYFYWSSRHLNSLRQPATGRGKMSDSPKR